MRTLLCDIMSNKNKDNKETESQTNHKTQRRTNRITKKQNRRTETDGLHLHNYDLFTRTHSLYLHVVNTKTTGSSDVSNTDARTLHAVLPVNTHTHIHTHTHHTSQMT